MLLLPAWAVVPPLPEDVSIVRTASGYEAAVEILRAPTAALAADLACIPSAHVRLLDVAARMDVPVVLFGTVAAAIPQAALQGLRLANQAELAQVLRELLTPPPTPAEAPKPVAPAQSPPARLTSAKTPAPVPPPRRAIPVPGEPKSAARSSEALTPEELRALLGDTP